jgi:uncharacterized iron-regulated membrane protein
MRKKIKALHRALALVFGAIFCLVCLTGAIMVFQKQIAEGLGYADHHDVPFFRAVMSLHRWLLMRPEHRGDMTLGRAIMGISAVASIVILISGFFLWVPTSKQKLKARFTINTGSGLRRFMHDAHIMLGGLACIFLLIMALTGPAFTFAPYREFLTSFIDMKLIKGLHMGWAGGLPLQIIYFIAAIIGAFLPISGYYMWWKKRQKKATTAKA